MPHYRQTIPFGPPITRMVKYLVVITSATFLLTYLPAQIFGWASPFGWFGLRPYDVTHNLYVWQPVTYLFLHAGFFHVIFNLFALWMFGADLESRWGGHQFLFYYFLTGIGAGLFNVVLEPSGLKTTIGCSGAVFGVLLAYGVLFPDRPIFLYFIIPIKAKWFVLIMGLIEFASSFETPGSGVSHVAHLGGMLVGYLYLRGRRIPFNFQSWYAERRRSRLKKKFDVYMRRQEKKDDAGRWIN